jgi:glycosyltransferase involved in cell wall biosynthesis
MKIAFYFSNIGLGNVDCSKPLNGNPGIGGSGYCFLLLIDSLKRYKPEYHLSVYVNEKAILPFNVDQIVVRDICHALTHSATQKNDLFLMKHVADKSTYERIDQLDQKVIVWGHNYYHSDLASWIANCNNVVLNIFVGRQQYDSYVDHDIIDKSTYIFNMIPQPIGMNERKNDCKTVVFMGAINKGKGFDVLAKQWKKILKEVPDAQLKVIGTGNVYNRNDQLGRLGVAHQSFEDQFVKYLSDENGKLLDSVRFLGLLGGEKYNVFEHSCVGVVNPSNTRETFGMSVIEMNTASLPVVTIKKNGFLDTVKNGETGLLMKKASHVYRGITRLLKDKDLNIHLGNHAKVFSLKFRPDIIVKDWIVAFEKVIDSEKSCYVKPSNNLLSSLKWLRITNRFLRKTCSLTFLPTITDVETFIHDLLIGTKK